MYLNKNKIRGQEMHVIVIIIGVVIIVVVLIDAIKLIVNYFWPPKSCRLTRFILLPNMCQGICGPGASCKPLVVGGTKPYLWIFQQDDLCACALPPPPTPGIISTAWSTAKKWWDGLWGKEEIEKAKEAKKIADERAGETDKTIDEVFDPKYGGDGH